MDRSGQLEKANASLRQGWSTLGRTLIAARTGEPYLAGRVADIVAWREQMGPWRRGSAGSKRTIALAVEMEHNVAEIRAGFGASRARAAAERATRDAERARQAEVARRAELAAQHRRMMAGTAEIAHRRAADVARMRSSGSGVASLFAPGDLREAGPG